MANPLTIYSTTWCGPCIRASRAQLERAGITYEIFYIDIEQVPEAPRDFVMSVNAATRPCRPSCSPTAPR